MAIEAGKLMLSRIETLLSKRKTFAIETTLATRTYASTIRQAQKDGYQVVLLFFLLPTPLLAVQRVASRVRSGGHNIPEDIIYRRYYRSLDNLFNIFMPIVDEWMLYDNSEVTVFVADKHNVHNNSIYNKIIESCQKKNSII